MRNAAKVKFGKIVLWLGLVLAVFSPSVGGAIPQEMNYQGYLTDAQGVPITGTILMTFRIYDSLSSWTKLWQENQNVQVASGVYSVTLGTITPITLPFDIPYYLGVSIQSDPEMTPRYPLTSVGYAFRAQVADAVSGSATYSSPIVSTVTTGTAPLQVTSTTNVTNLNSDLLDGKHASDFGTTSQITNLQTQVTSLQTQVSTLQTQVTNLLTLFSNFTRSGNNIYVTGANLHIRSGSGATDGAVNGTGNLIIGYNEMVSGQTKSGSHNLVVGKENDYSSYGGIVAGQRNVISAMYATVAGGYGNTASGNNAAVAGGNTNLASASSATVTGGYNNEASALFSSVSGGAYNVASGSYGSVSGGENNSVTNAFASVSGGRYNVASARWSHVSGGGGGGATAGNEAYSEYSAILGGGQNTTGDPASGNRTIGSWSTVSGGIYGNATANWASVVGGSSNTASGVYSAVLGGQNNTASGFYSSVGGGYQNSASGSNSTVSGGYTNTAGTTYATVSGALPQYDSGWVNIAQDQAITLIHNLGGDPDDYTVDLQFNANGYRHIHSYGGDYIDGNDNIHGAYWGDLGSTSIIVVRGSNDPWVGQIRVRIWVNKKL